MCHSAAAGSKPNAPQHYSAWSQNIVDENMEIIAAGGEHDDDDEFYELEDFFQGSFISRMLIGKATTDFPTGDPEDYFEGSIIYEILLLEISGGGKGKYLGNSAFLREAEVHHNFKMPPVINQGPCGGCASIAVTSVAAAHHAIGTGVPRQISCQHCIDCCAENHPSPVVDAVNCKAASLLQALQFLAWEGAVEEKDYPYVAMGSPCPDLEGKRLFIDAYANVDRKDVKLHLKKYPLVALIKGTRDLSYHRGEDIFDKVCVDGEEPTTHAWAVIGYGTELLPDGTEGREYYIVQNSWGTTWGFNGLAKISPELLFSFARPIGTRFQ